MSAKIDPRRLVHVAEDIEHFVSWVDQPNDVNTVAIRHGSAILRRLLVEDVLGMAWRQMKFSKSPQLQGPDLLARLETIAITLPQVVTAVAAGVRYQGVESAFLGCYRVDNADGTPAMADVGFAVSVSHVTRKVGNYPIPLEFAGVIDRIWYLPEYLAAPGMIRRGMALSRREILKHVANEMAGVHLGKNTSAVVDLLREAETATFISSPHRELRGHMIEVLAIGQAVGSSHDLRNLAAEIRKKT